MSEKPKLWGGAFSDAPDELAWRFGQSFEDDKNLWREEIEVSIAHTEMLRATGIVSEESCDAILNALHQIALDESWLTSHYDAEDIHSALEGELEERIGDVAKHMTVARSRNDQIATVSRLWVSRKAIGIAGLCEGLQSVVLHRSKQTKNEPLLGVTHLQAAQPITLGYHLMTYFWMLQRDKERFVSVAENAMHYCPLGSCAIAGTSLPIDRETTARKLGFDSASPSAIDSVSDRDFVADTHSAITLLMQHLSRLSQELIIWATPQFRYVRIADAYSTGSSLMPQKRNPDIAELIRGRAAQAIGNYTAFLTIMIGLPLAYNRDMQDDKPGLYRSVSLAGDSIVLMTEMLRTATFDTGRMAKDADATGATATDAAEKLVKEGMTFRDAHEEIGRRVRAGGFDDVSADESIRSRASYGGVGDLEVQLAVAEALLTPSG